MSEVVRESLKTAVKGTTLVFVSSVASIFLWFVTKVLIVRGTTKEEFGIYSLAIATASILAVIANAGLQDGITRFISIFLGEGRKEDAEAVSKSSLQIGLATSLTASIGLYLFAPAAAKYVFYMPELIAPLRAISFFPVFQVLSGVLVGILRGHGLINPRVYYISIGHPLFFFMLLVVFLAIELSLISIIYAFLISLIIVCFGIGVHGYVTLRFNPLALLGGGFRKELFRFSLPLIGVALMGMIFTWTDTFMLGRYTGAANVGVYNVGMSLARLLGFALSALGFVFMPIAGEMYSRQQMPELKKTYQVLTKWVFSATLPLFFILFFFPENVVTFLFEERYLDSSAPLRVLSVGYLSCVFIGANATILIVLGMTRQLFNISVFGAVLNVALNYLFIKRLGYGVMGASAATMISLFASNSLLALLLYLRSGIHPLTAKYLRPIAGSAIIGLVLYVIAKSLPLYYWMLPIYLVLFIIGYLASLLMSRSLAKEDLDLFEAVSDKTGIRMEPIRALLHKFTHK
jgi:O-antigen/teichoic acid export membrane protein